MSAGHPAEGYTAEEFILLCSM